MKEGKTLDQMRGELMRQILEIALETDNPQFKLDAFKCTQERGKAPTPAAEMTVDAMTTFRNRVLKAEAGNGPN